MNCWHPKKNHFAHYEGCIQLCLFLLLAQEFCFPVNRGVVGDLCVYFSCFSLDQSTSSWPWCMCQFRCGTDRLVKSEKARICKYLYHVTRPQDIGVNYRLYVYYILYIYLLFSIIFIDIYIYAYMKVCLGCFCFSVLRWCILFICFNLLAYYALHGWLTS